MVTTCVVLVDCGTASANVADVNPPTPSVVVNSSGSVSVTVSGTWYWPVASSGKTSKDGESPGGDLVANAANPCGVDHLHYAIGWAMAWNDPQDPGYTLSATDRGQAYTLNVGSSGDSLNPADKSVDYDTSDPCGVFSPTELTGTWSASHVYSSVESLPSTACVVIYDVHSAPRANNAQYDVLLNRDNTFVWETREGLGGSFDSSTNCFALPAAAKPAVADQTVAKPSAVPVATRSLAFTGAGTGLRVVGWTGAALVVGGLLLLVATDTRRLLAVAPTGSDSSSRRRPGRSKFERWLLGR